MKVIQLLPTIKYGDAIGNDTIAINRVLRRNGFITGIYAENIGPKIRRTIALPIKELPDLSEDDIVLYHLSTGTDLNLLLPKMKGRKVIIYHNITPPYFFEPYDQKMVKKCVEGLGQAFYLSKYAEYCIADSEFDKNDLIKMGYTCNIDILPILIPFSDYDSEPSSAVISRYNDGYTNIIFVGRIAPNKKDEDIITAFYYYKKYINPKSRLIFIGDYNGMKSYYERLKCYANRLLLKDCIFTGHIPFPEILAYYRIADVFLCMSEHEGFCVPLVEAMYFGIPIIAFKSSAIPDTLGKGGILLEKKDPMITAEMINAVITSEELRQQILNEQKKQLQRFSTKVVENEFLKYISAFMENN